MNQSCTIFQAASAFDTETTTSGYEQRAACKRAAGLFEVVSAAMV
jgi:hypothetical protein